MPSGSWSTRNHADLVVRVLQHAEHRERVLHVCGLEELEPAELHERDVATEQLDLEHVGVVRRAEQHGLVLERGASFACGEHRAADRVGLTRLVEARLERRHAAAGALGPQRLLVALRRDRDHRVDRSRIGVVER